MPASRSVVARGPRRAARRAARRGRCARAALAPSGGRAHLDAHRQQHQRHVAFEREIARASMPSSVAAQALRCSCAQIARAVAARASASIANARRRGRRSPPGSAVACSAASSARAAASCAGRWRRAALASRSRSAGRLRRPPGGCARSRPSADRSCHHLRCRGTPRARAAGTAGTPLAALDAPTSRRRTRGSCAWWRRGTCPARSTPKSVQIRLSRVAAGWSRDGSRPKRGSVGFSDSVNHHFSPGVSMRVARQREADEQHVRRQVTRGTASRPASPPRRPGCRGRRPPRAPRARRRRDSGGRDRRGRGTRAGRRAPDRRGAPSAPCATAPRACRRRAPASPVQNDEKYVPR